MRLKPQEEVDLLFYKASMLEKEVERLRAALEKIAQPDGLTEASAGAMVFQDLESKKQIARVALEGSDSVRSGEADG